MTRDFSCRESTFNVMSFGLPPSLADALGICTIEGEDPIAFCVAFGECAGGLPTFAMSISGPAIGCTPHGTVPSPVSLSLWPQVPWR